MYAFPEHSPTATLENEEPLKYDSDSDPEYIPEKSECQSNYIKTLIFATDLDHL